MFKIGIQMRSKGWNLTLIFSYTPILLQQALKVSFSCHLTATLVACDIYHRTTLIVSWWDGFKLPVMPVASLPLSCVVGGTLSLFLPRVRPLITSPSRAFLDIPGRFVLLGMSSFKSYQSFIVLYIPSR